MRAWPLLATAAVAMIAAAVRITKAGMEVVGSVMMVAGLITWGTWIAVEVINMHNGGRSNRNG